jgi:hypothetical protein
MKARSRGALSFWPVAATPVPCRAGRCRHERCCLWRTLPSVKQQERSCPGAHSSRDAWPGRCGATTGPRFCHPRTAPRHVHVAGVLLSVSRRHPALQGWAGWLHGVVNRGAGPAVGIRRHHGPCNGTRDAGAGGCTTATHLDAPRRPRGTLDALRRHQSETSQSASAQDDCYPPWWRAEGTLCPNNAVDSWQP